LSNPSVQLDPPSERTLAIIAQVAGRHGLPWMITGAMARTLVFEGIHGIGAGRATRDWDLGVQVEDWQSFRILRQELEDEHGFVSDPRQEQRLHSPEGPLVDLIPFGGVAVGPELVYWGQEGETRLNVSGFQEAFEAAWRVRLGEGTDVRVISPAGLALLKAVAWQDRHRQHDRDGEDLAYLLSNYHHLIREALFGAYLEVMDSVGYDPPLAGAVVLGREVAGMASPELRQAIRRWLAAELADPEDSRLVGAFERYLPASEAGRAAELLGQFERGVTTEGGVGP
jgi:predicted nucleotidyltransferase